MSKARPRVALLAGPSFGGRVIARALARELDLVGVIREDRVPRRQLLERRFKKLGVLPVLDMLAFQMLLVPTLGLASRRRAAEIREAHDLQDPPFDPRILTRVRSVNAPEARQQLASWDPDVVVIAGTRIIKRKVLRCVEAPFVNVHVGITPAYRGVHGGYHALAEQRADLAGVTVHLVDPGIDTGGVLRQTLIRPTAADDFTTYPLLQLAAALPLLLESVRELAEGRASPVPPLSETSQLHYHPRASGYLYRRWLYGVR